MDPSSLYWKHDYALLKLSKTTWLHIKGNTRAARCPVCLEKLRHADKGGMYGARYQCQRCRVLCHSAYGNSCFGENACLACTDEEWYGP